MAVSANRLELLQIADAVAREKAIDRGIVIAAMEDAIQKAARSRYGSETEVRAEINPKTGEMRLSRLLLVADQVENDATQIALEDAKKRNPAAQVGDYIAEALPPLEYGRIAAQSAKQVIVQKVREAERDRQYQEYKDRIGDIVNGIVKRVEYGNVIVDLGRGEAIVRRDELIPRETFRPGQGVRAYSGAAWAWLAACLVATARPACSSPFPPTALATACPRPYPWPSQGQQAVRAWRRPSSSSCRPCRDAS